MKTTKKTYKVCFDGEVEDEEYDSYSDALYVAGELSGSYHLGGEILEMSNLGDYPYDPDDEPDMEIVEFQDGVEFGRILL